MTKINLDTIHESEEYKALIKQRARITWPLAFLMFIVYYAFILIIAFMPELLGVPIGDGHTTTGLIVGLGVILFSFVLTGIYVHKANTVLEPMTEDLHKKLGVDDDG